MPAWILAALPAFESGFWLGQLGLRSRQRAKIRERLIWGRKPATQLPVIDGQLKKMAGHPTRNQQRVANYVVRAIRWFTNTKALEYLVLKEVRAKWPKGKRIDPHIRVIV